MTIVPESAERWRRIEALFLRAVELDPSARSALLAAHDDRPEAAEVERMLHADGELQSGPAVNPASSSAVNPASNPSVAAKPTDRLRAAVDRAAADLAADHPSADGLGAALLQAKGVDREGSNQEGRRGASLGQRVGAYRLERELGRGGMSTVYLAHRTDRAFEHAVAIKFVRHGLADRLLGRRLVTERQILARLAHPYIASLFDGGTTDDGTPYFVMERVDGLPIDRYCDRHGLDVRQRIELFRKVCLAVEYAHRNLVVHRDLKPSNVLVTDDGTPKLLDFGIAKLLASTGDEPTLPTQRIGTPGYASPEQLSGQPITTATDTYSLGVLLYRLLTGRLPFPRPESTPVHSAAEAMQPRQPPLPSVASRQASTSPMAGERPSILARQLVGDLDTILLTALRQEPERRYASVRELSADLGRHLDGHPVLARPDSFLYRAGKFVQRHRLGVVAGLLALLLSALFVVTMVDQRRRAEREQQKAEQVSALLVSLFQMAGPNTERGQTLTARQLLDHGRDQLGRLDDQPETQSMLRATLAGLYEELGLFEPAAELFSQVLDYRRRHLGPRAPEVAEGLYRLGRVRARSGDYATAEPLFRQALEMRRAVLGDDHPDVAVSLNSLALVLHETGDYAAAAPLYEQALRQAETRLGPDDPQAVKTEANLALLWLDLGDYAAAERRFRHALAGWRRIPDRQEMVAEVLDGLGQTLFALDRADEAEEPARESLELRRRLYGDRNPTFARSLAHVAEIVGASDPAEALEPALRALALRRSSLGEESAEVAESLAILARIRLASGDSAAAEELYRQSAAVYARSLGPEHPMTQRPTAELAAYLASVGRCDEAAEPLDLAARYLPARDRRMAAVEGGLARCRSEPRARPGTRPEP